MTRIWMVGRFAMVGLAAWRHDWTILCFVAAWMLVDTWVIYAERQKRR